MRQLHQRSAESIDPYLLGATHVFPKMGFKNLGGGWPYLYLNHQEVVLPKTGFAEVPNPPVDPLELCRSTFQSGDLWLFTCECGVHSCGDIWAPIRVDHQNGTTTWWNPAVPGSRFAVFHTEAYRRVIIAALEIIQTCPPPKSSLTWRCRFTQEQLGMLLRQARG